MRRPEICGSACWARRKPPGKRSIWWAVRPLLGAVDLEVSSGVWACQYRLGDHKIRTELEELLNAGTAAGRRLLASVKKDRRVRVWEEPAPGAEDWGMFRDGSIRDAGDRVYPGWKGPVGVWARLRDGLPGSVDVTRLADISRVFIERVEWSEKEGRLGVAGR